MHQGESTDSIVDALSQQHVIGSSLAFQVSEVFHGTPSVLPGSYAMHQNLAFSEVRTLLAAGPNIYPVDVRPGFTFSEVEAAGRQHSRSPPREASSRPRRAVPCTRRSSATDPQQPGGDARHRDLPGAPRRERHPPSSRTWCSGSTTTAPRPASPPRRPVAGLDALPAPHRGVDRGEGGVHRGEHARYGSGHLQPSGPGHAAPDGLDRSVRAGPGRGSGDAAGPQGPVPVQHLPHDWSDSDTHLHAFHGCAPGCGPPTDRALGCTSCW